MKKRAICFTLAVLMIITAFSTMAIPAFAASYNGTCGENLTWELDTSSGVLTISGNGLMGNYDNNETAPWFDLKKSVTSVTINDGVTSIGNSAFSQCSALASITIPDSVTKIGNSAFYGCSKLTSATLPEGLTEIGGGVFLGCSALTSVDIPKSLVAIGNKAFSGCSELKSITIPENVTTIGNSAFSNCVHLSEIYYNAISIANFTSSSDLFYNAGVYSNGIKVIFGDSVKKIPEYIFNVNDSRYTPKIVSVKFGKNITDVGIDSFDYCYKLTEVQTDDIASWSNINFGNGSANPLSYAKLFYVNGNEITDLILPEGVTAIGNYAFYNCQSLTSVVIPEGATAIGKYGFAYCKSLKSITIPKSIISIGDWAFEGSVLETIYYNGSKSDWDKISTLNPGISSRVNIIFAVCEHEYDNACDTTCNICGKEREITHSYSDVWSRNSTNHWYECSVCKDKKDIAAHIFDNACDTTCNICNYRRTTSHQYKSTWSTDGTQHWHECSVCHDKKDVANHIFENACDTTCETCGYTREITHKYAETWSKDGTNHWYECSVCHDKKDVSNHIFENACDTTCETCGYTREITHKYSEAWSTDETQHWYECSVCHDKKDVASHKFDNACDKTCETCGYTREITHKYSDTWSKDGTNHWHECLVCHDKKDIAKHTYDENYICTSCGYADRSCGENTIWSLDTESGILTISGTGEMFDYDDGAKLSPWHNQISCIKSVVICEGVTNIGNYAFYNCRYLVTIMISESVTDIGDSAFAACTNLGSIDVAAGNKNYYSEGNCLIEINTKILILGCKNSIIPNGILGIGDFAFAYCSSLSSINIPESVTSIENHAFYGCTALIAIFIPKNVANIEALAFSACTNLGSIDVATENKSYYSEGNCLIQINTKILILGCKNSIIPNNVVGIGDFAFAYCNSLSSISIPKSITSIGSNAFYGCSALVSLIIPKSVVNIGENAFADCVGLEKLYYGGTEEDWQRITVNYEIYIIIYIEFSYCEHEYDNVCDAVCNICNKERTAPHKYSAKYSSDDSNHWYECELCHNKKEIFGHNCGEDGLCVVCGFVIYIHGDLDGVEGVTSDDAIYLLYAIYFPNSYPVNQNCDFDGNGEVTSDDAIYLLYHVYFKNEYPI